MIARLAFLEALAVELVANIAPWLAPLPTAWLVADRAIRYLHWPWWIALVAGMTLELLGVAILATTLELYDYNRSKRKSDPVAAMWLPAGLVVVYFLTAEALTIALDVWPVAAVIAPALFPVLSIAAFALLALRADHRQRLVDIEQDKEDTRARREQRKREKEQTEQVAEQLEQVSEQPEPELVPILPFACSFCGARFASQRALSGHGNKHRSDNGNEHVLEREGTFYGHR